MPLLYLHCLICPLHKPGPKCWHPFSIVRPHWISKVGLNMVTLIWLWHACCYYRSKLVISDTIRLISNSDVFRTLKSFMWIVIFLEVDDVIFPFVFAYARYSYIAYSYCFGLLTPSLFNHYKMNDNHIWT